MGDIHQLPDSMQRQWRVFERVLKNFMVEASCSAAEIDYALGQLKPLYLRYAQPNQFSGDPETVLKELNEWVQTQLSGLMQVIVARDVELFRLRGGK